MCNKMPASDNLRGGDRCSKQGSILDDGLSQSCSKTMLEFSRHNKQQPPVIVQFRIGNDNQQRQKLAIRSRNSTYGLNKSRQSLNHFDELSNSHKATNIINDNNINIRNNCQYNINEVDSSAIAGLLKLNRLKLSDSFESKPAIESNSASSFSSETKTNRTRMYQGNHHHQQVQYSHENQYQPNNYYVAHNNHNHNINSNNDNNHSHHHLDINNHQHHDYHQPTLHHFETIFMPGQQLVHYQGDDYCSSGQALMPTLIADPHTLETYSRTNLNQIQHQAGAHYNHENDKNNQSPVSSSNHGESHHFLSGIMDSDQLIIAEQNWTPVGSSGQQNLEGDGRRVDKLGGGDLPESVASLNERAIAGDQRQCMDEQAKCHSTTGLDEPRLMLLGEHQEQQQQQQQQQQQRQTQHTLTSLHSAAADSSESVDIVHLNKLSPSSSTNPNLLGSSAASTVYSTRSPTSQLTDSRSASQTSTVASANQRQQFETSAGRSGLFENDYADEVDDDDGDESGLEELKVCEWENCGNTFTDIREFVQHLSERHVNQEPREKNRYFCLWSNCKRNAQEFNARYKLLIHMRVHSGEKPYACESPNCKKSFSRLENLKIHKRSHTGEKPYKCAHSDCSKSFTNSSDRIKHHKTHKDPKPYTCAYEGCTKRYTDPSSLRKHLRAHERTQHRVSMTSAPDRSATISTVISSPRYGLKRQRGQQEAYELQNQQYYGSGGAEQQHQQQYRGEAPRLVGSFADTGEGQPMLLQLGHQQAEPGHSSLAHQIDGVMSGMPLISADYDPSTIIDSINFGQHQSYEQQQQQEADYTYENTTTAAPTILVAEQQSAYSTQDAQVIVDQLSDARPVYQVSNSMEHHHNQSQQHQQQHQTSSYQQDNNFESQHQRFSQSWCAGSSLSSRSLRPFAAARRQQQHPLVQYESYEICAPEERQSAQLAAIDNWQTRSSMNTKIGEQPINDGFSMQPVSWQQSSPSSNHLVSNANVQISFSQSSINAQGQRLRRIHTASSADVSDRRQHATLMRSMPPPSQHFASSRNNCNF